MSYQNPSYLYMKNMNENEIEQIDGESGGNEEAADEVSGNGDDETDNAVFEAVVGDTEKNDEGEETAKSNDGDDDDENEEVCSNVTKRYIACKMPLQIYPSTEQLL